MRYEKLDADPPATDRELREVEEVLDSEFPAGLRGVLVDANGVVYWDGVREIQFLGTRGMIEAYEDHDFPEFMPGAFPFAMDGSGHFLVLARGRGEEVHVVHAGALSWEDSRKIASSLEEFLDDPRRPEAYLAD